MTTSFSKWRAGQRPGGYAGAALFVLFMATGPAILHAGEVIDRLVEVVDMHPILQSELEDQIRYEALMEGRPLEQVTRGARQASLARLTDQWLIRRQMDLEKFNGAGAPEISGAVQKARAQIPGATSDAEWSRLLARYGLSAEDITAHVATQIDTLRFIDLRFRPTVKIEASSIAEYYRQNVVAAAAQKGLPAPPLQKVSSEIEKILVEKQIDTMLAAWLQSLRLLSRVEVVAATQ